MSARTGSSPVPPSEDPSVAAQRAYWDLWNADNRELEQSEVARRQAVVVRSWLDAAARTDRDLLEVGCGSGWLSGQLTAYGDVVATDLSVEVLERASKRFPDVRFVHGDFMTMDLPAMSFDVVVSLEVLAHVRDQVGFVRRLATALRPGGELLLATQNRPVLEQRCYVAAPSPDQIRHWVSRRELVDLLRPAFEILEVFTVTPVAHKWPHKALASWRLHTALGPWGSALRAALERRDWGWTIMARARLKGSWSDEIHNELSERGQ